MRQHSHESSAVKSRSEIRTKRVIFDSSSMFQITQKYTAPKHLTILMRVCARKGGTKPAGWAPTKKAPEKAPTAHARFKATRNGGGKVWIFDVDVFVVGLRR